MNDVEGFIRIFLDPKPCLDYLIKCEDDKK